MGSCSRWGSLLRLSGLLASGDRLETFDLEPDISDFLVFLEERRITTRFTTQKELTLSFENWLTKKFEKLCTYSSAREVLDNHHFETNEARFIDHS